MLWFDNIYFKLKEKLHKMKPMNFIPGRRNQELSARREQQAERNFRTQGFTYYESDESQQSHIQHRPLLLLDENSQINRDPVPTHKDPSSFLSCRDLAIHKALNPDPNLHFNPPEIRRESSLPGRISRGKRHNRAHNLKNIATHILNVVSSNRHLTVKQIAFILFQIMGQTSLGKQIIQREYPTFDSDLIKMLTFKYKDDQIQSPQVRMVIRNVRRRLYDALNVMIASEVIKKKSNSTYTIINLRPKIAEERTLDAIDEEEEAKKIEIDRECQILNEQMRKMEKRLIRKRKIMREKQEMLAKMTSFIERNQFDMRRNLFELPIVAINGPSKMIINMERQHLQIKSRHPLHLLSDMDLIEMVFRREQQPQSDSMIKFSEE